MFDIFKEKDPRNYRLTARQQKELEDASGRKLNPNYVYAKTAYILHVLSTD